MYLQNSLGKRTNNIPDRSINICSEKMNEAFNNRYT